MKSKKRKIVIIILFILITIGVVVVGFNIFKSLSTPDKKDDKPKEKEKTPVVEFKEELDENQKKVKEMSIKYNEYLVDSTKTAIDYYELTGLEPKYFMPMVGKNSSQETGIPEEFLKEITEDLTPYDEALEKYSSKLNKTIKEHYSFKLIGDPLYTEDKTQLMQQMEIKPFSYILYRNDLQNVTDEIITLSKLNVEKEGAETIVILYKARIKAMEILNSQLSVYKNEKIQKANLIYDIGEKIKCNSCHFYINDAQGFYLDEVKVNGNINNYEKDKKLRISKIIAKAVEKGILDKKKPLRLKDV